MNSFLVRQQRAFRVEHTLAIFDAAEERHLVSDAEQGAMFEALVPVKTALVLEAEATVTILTHVQITSDITRTTTVRFHVLKRPQITTMLIRTQPEHIAGSQLTVKFKTLS